MVFAFRIIALGLLLFFGLTPAQPRAEGVSTIPPGSYLCGVRTCGAWGAKGANTCRSCNQAICAKNPTGGGEVITGNASSSDCYEGHGDPPETGTQPKKPPASEAAPITKSGTPRAK